MDDKKLAEAIKKQKEKQNDELEIQEVKENLKPKKRKIPIPASDFLSTGAALLNCGLTGDPYKGIFKGDFFLFVGTRKSGKSYVTMNIFAEAALNKNFNDYRFINDAGENGALMDIENHFGKAVKERIEPPHRDKQGNPVMSSLVEELYYYLDDAFDDGRPFIYLKDSLDDLSDRAGREKFYEQKSAFMKGKEVAGSFQVGKPKIHAGNLNNIMHRLHKTKSIFIGISQTKDNIGFASQFKPQVRSGGHSLGYFTQMEVWSSIKKKLTIKINDKSRHIGNLCHFKIEKTRITARECEVDIPIYWSSGIDDLGSCINYLVEEKHWKKKSKKGEEVAAEKTGGIITADEFDFSGKIDDLIAKIEEENRENELRDLVGKVWRDIEQQCEVIRKKRYV